MKSSKAMLLTVLIAILRRVAWKFENFNWVWTCDLARPWMATGSELFFLLTCLVITSFILVSIFAPLEMIRLKIWETLLSWHAKCLFPVALRGLKTLHGMTTYFIVIIGWLEIFCLLPNAKKGIMPKELQTHKLYHYATRMSSDKISPHSFMWNGGKKKTVKGLVCNGKIMHFNHKHT